VEGARGCEGMLWHWICRRGEAGVCGGMLGLVCMGEGESVISPFKAGAGMKGTHTPCAGLPRLPPSSLMYTLRSRPCWDWCEGD
jgi:hypothetical protein